MDNQIELVCWVLTHVGETEMLMSDELTEWIDLFLIYDVDFSGLETGDGLTSAGLGGRPARDEGAIEMRRRYVQPVLRISTKQFMFSMRESHPFLQSHAFLSRAERNLERKKQRWE